jgi:2-hydroxychromene-2-carboxylate isomerase
LTRVPGSTVDFYYDFSSTNSYFAAFMLPEVCKRAGAAMRWLPLHSAALFRGTGFDVMAMTPRKARYLWRDHARYAQVTGLPFRRPSRFPIKTALTLRCVLAADHEGGGGEKGAKALVDFSQAVFRSYWERDEDIADAAVVGALISSIGLSPDAVLQRANSSEIRDELRAITEAAGERGVFGVPMFFVGNEMFWGKDRLDFVERWLSPGAQR